MGESEDVQRDGSSGKAEQNELSAQVEPRINWRQVMGCFSATSLSFAGGVGFGHTSSLFPALVAPDSQIPTTAEENAWLASSGALSAPMGAILSGFLMENFGRLATIQLSVIPLCISWIAIATAHDYTTLLIARIMIGIAYAMGTSPAGVLIAETALKKYRGALSSIGLSLMAFGILCGYIMGAYLDWRTFAWVSVLSPLIPFILAWIFTAESPLWLRSRGRTKAAQRASLYYYGDPDYVVQAVVPQCSSKEIDADVEKTDQTQTSNKPSFSNRLKQLLTLPSGLKPLIILNVIFLSQDLSGVWIIMANAVQFFQEGGSSIDPYFATIMVGVIKFIGSFITIFLLRHCKRRALMIPGTVIMAICMAASAYATTLALAERQGGPASFFPSWFGVTCVVIYQLAATIGLQNVPWTMSSEIYPQNVRGAAQSLNYGLSNLFMFATLQAYPWMNTLLGGTAGIQYFFGAASLVAGGIVWIFCPETHGKTLTEIEVYFSKNTVYLRHTK